MITNGTKVTNLYGQTLTILSIYDNIVTVYEQPNDTIHASNLFINGNSLLDLIKE